MTEFYRAPLDGREEDPFTATAKISCSGGPFGLDLSDRSVVLIMTQGIGTRLTADEKRVTSLISGGRT